MTPETANLSARGLQQYSALRGEAMSAVTNRFYADHESIYARFGEKGRAACTEDLGFHLDFLRPVLEFGLLAPMVDYLRWLAGVLETRGIPAEHLAQSLDWLGEFFASRMEPLDSGVVVAALQAVKEQFQMKDEGVAAMYARLPPEGPACADFEAALLAGDRKSAAAIIEQSQMQGQSLVEAELHVIQPALYRIGQKWEANQVSVAQEHLATAIAQSVMVQGMMRSVPAAPNGKRVVLACVSGNNHVVGLQMVADAFELAGWQVNFLGANVPTPSLVQHAVEWKADLVGLSVSFAQQLGAVKEVIARLRAVPGGQGAPVIIGGLAINNFDRLAGQMGADAWSPNAADAVVSGARVAMTP